MTKSPYVVLAIIGSLAISAPQFAGAADGGTKAVRAPRAITLRAKKKPFPLRRPALIKPRAFSIQSATIQINFDPTPQFGDQCGSWPDGAKAAMEYAARLWGLYLDSNVPISLDACWAANLSAGILGHGGTLGAAWNFAGAPKLSTMYQYALANSLAGTDIDPDSADMYLALSNKFDWYYPTDGNVPAGQYDLATVALHELAHGMGFAGSMVVSAGKAYWGWGYGVPMAYDSLAYNGYGQSLTNTAVFPNPSSSLAYQLTSGDIYFNGAHSQAANGGQPVKLFSPSTWMQGSSYSHVDQTFDNTLNSLMTYSVSDGESQHVVGPVLLGMMADLGWKVREQRTSQDADLAGLFDQGLKIKKRQVRFHYTVVNLGGTASNAAKIKLYISKQSTIPPTNTIKKKTIEIPALSPGQSYTAGPVRMKSKKKKIAGKHLLAEIDPESASGDSDYGNNTSTLKLQR